MTNNVTPMTGRSCAATPTTPQDTTALQDWFMDVHANINDALNLLAVIEDEVAINPKAASLAHALALLLRQAGYSNQCASIAVCPGLFDIADITDWLPA